MKPTAALFENALHVEKISNIHVFSFEQGEKEISNCHELRELIYIDGGRAYFRSPRYEGTLEDGHMILCNPMEPYTLTSIPNQWAQVVTAGFLCNHPDLERFSEMPVRLTKDLQGIISDVQREGERIFLPPYGLPYKKEMDVRQSSTFALYQMARLKMESFLIRLIREGKLPKQETTQKGIDISDVYDYLNNHFDSAISLDMLSKVYNVNKNTLCSLFKSTYGVSIIDYVNATRIRRAKIHLREGVYNITQIAEMLGFSSVHYFSRLFKQYTTLSPSAYAKEVKQKSSEAGE